MPTLFAGIDAGKTHHHCVVIDTAGTKLLSRRFRNTEPDILTLIGDVHQLITPETDAAADPDEGDGDEVVWATDLNHGGASLLLTVLEAHGQVAIYIPGRMIHFAARSYRGDGKTDAKDAAVIADQARMRRDLHPNTPATPEAIELRMLTDRRGDLVRDRTRAINRLRQLLLEIFPALEQAFDYASRRAALLLLTKYQTPGVIRRAGVARIASWLRARGARYTTQVATRAVEAAQQQYATVAGEQHIAAMIAELADDALRLSERTEQLDGRITEAVERNEQATLLTSMPGFGSLLAAEFVAASGGNVLLLAKADRLAGVCGLAPVSKDSGTISGNRHRPRRYDRRMLRTCYISAQTAARVCPQSSAYYQRKRGEGKSHVQAVLCLARRRINVIFAMLRDNRTFQTDHHAGAQHRDGLAPGTPDSGFSDAPACESPRPTGRRRADLVGVGG